MTRLTTLGGVAFSLVLLILMTSTPVAQSRHRTDLSRVPGVVAGLASWMTELFEGRWRSAAPNPEVTLHVPAATNEPVIPFTVSTSLAGVGDFHIDVDLNHDGVFEGRGERGYAAGRFDRHGSGTVRLHGLIAGRYQARVRFSEGNREVVSAVQDFEVLPPSHHLPVSFEPNVGQTDPAVLFLGRARGQMVFITAAETVLVGSGGEAQRFRLLGANSWVRPTGEKKLPGTSNYFMGNDPSKWRSDIETYQEVVTHNVYAGIDLVYHSSQGRLMAASCTSRCSRASRWRQI